MDDFEKLKRRLEKLPDLPGSLPRSRQIKEGHNPLTFFDGHPDVLMFIAVLDGITDEDLGYSFAMYKDAFLQHVQSCSKCMCRLNHQMKIQAELAMEKSLHTTNHCDN